MVHGIYFLSHFLREASRNEDCNEVPELEMHNLYLFFQAVQIMKPVGTPVAILGSLGVCIYVPASRHWLISYSPIHLT